MNWNKMSFISFVIVLKNDNLYEESIADASRR